MVKHSSFMNHWNIGVQDNEPVVYNYTFSF